MSSGQLQDFKHADEYAIISFRDAEEYNIQELQKFALAYNEPIKNHNNILFIEANDVEDSLKLRFMILIKRTNMPIKLFNLDQANQILEFVDKNKDKHIIVQCVYGKSRSLTTAIVLEETLLKETHRIEHNEKVVRNQSIYNKLLEAISNRIAQ